MTVHIIREDGIRKIEENIEKIIHLDDGRIQLVYHSKREWFSSSVVYRAGSIIECVEE